MTDYDKLTDRDKERARQYFEDRVLRSEGCWKWTGHVAPSTGYGYASVGRVYHGPAHRLSFELFVGPIPKGLQLDHLCRQRDCVNPKHLEPVTSAENVLRGTGITANNARKMYCQHGHPLSGKNLKLRPDGYRACRACRLAFSRAHSAKKSHPHGFYRRVVELIVVSTPQPKTRPSIEYVRVLECGHKTKATKWKPKQPKACCSECTTVEIR